MDSQDIICGLAEDEKKNIWISTHQGISKLNPPEKKFINYYAGDGLQGNEFTRTAVFKDKRGKTFLRYQWSNSFSTPGYHRNQKKNECIDYRLSRC